MEVLSEIRAIATGIDMDHVPAAGSDEVMRHFGSSVWTAVGAPTDTPRMRVGLCDLVSGPAWFLNSSMNRGWSGPRRLLINPTTFLRLQNPAAGGGQNLSYDGQRIHLSGIAPSNVVSGVITLAGAGLGVDTVLIRPAVGDAYKITDFGSNTWVGAAPAGLPNILVEIGDGTIWAVVCDGLNIKLWFTEDMALYITNNVYLRITNLAAGAAVVGWSGERIHLSGTGGSIVQSAIATVGIGGAANIRPVDVLDQWEVSGIFASQQVGGGGVALANVSVNNNNAVIQSLKARSTDIECWLHPWKVPVSNANYLTVTDLSGAGGNIAYSAIRTRLG
jgi:hypothetical protein